MHLHLWQCFLSATERSSSFFSGTSTPFSTRFQSSWGWKMVFILICQKLKFSPLKIGARSPFPLGQVMLDAYLSKVRSNKKIALIQLVILTNLKRPDFQTQLGSEVMIEFDSDCACVRACVMRRMKEHYWFTHNFGLNGKQEGRRIESAKLKNVTDSFFILPHTQHLSLRQVASLSLSKPQ